MKGNFEEYSTYLFSSYPIPVPGVVMDSSLLRILLPCTTMVWGFIWVRLLALGMTRLLSRIVTALGCDLVCGAA